MKELEMTETKNKLEPLLSKLDEYHLQLNKAKAKQAELTNHLQDQTQKVESLFMSVTLLTTPAERVATEKM